MESRAATKKRLRELLKDAGVYEDGMGEEEMLQLADVMQMSMVETCQQQANELEFLRMQPSELHSSTLIVAPQVPIITDFDACGSPPSEPIYLTVRAMVHHAMDWSPSKNEELRRKRSSTDSNPPLSEPGAKRFLRLLSDREETHGDQHQEEQPYNTDATPVSLNQDDVDDSGITWEEVSFSSIADTSSMPSIGEIPSGHMVSTSSVAVSESSESHEEASHDQIYE